MLETIPKQEIKIHILPFPLEFVKNPNFLPLLLRVVAKLKGVIFKLIIDEIIRTGIREALNYFIIDKLKNHFSYPHLI